MAIAALLVAATLSPTAGAIEKVGTEFRINVNVTGAQDVPDVAADASGNFVVVWQDGSHPDDGSDTGVFARRFDAAGNPLEAPGTGGDSEFKVPTATLNAQANPEVARHADGAFIIVWQSTNQDVNGGEAIYAKRYDSAGVAQAVPASPSVTEFRVHAGTTNNTYRNPDVAVDGLGNFVVVWESTVQGGGNEDLDIYARMFDAAGNPLASEFIVNDSTTGDQTLPAVAADGSGNFIVTWQSTDGDSNGTSIFARQFSSAGTAVAGQFQVNTTTTGDQTTPAIAADTSGNFVVLWESADASGKGIFAKRFDAAGVAQETPASSGNTQFALNSTTANEQSFPSLDMSVDGSFVAVWQSFNQPDDSDEFGVFARAFSADGSAASDELQANTFTQGSQKLPSVALDGVGNFVVVWDSPQDTNATGVYAQRFGLGLDAFACYNAGERSGQPAFVPVPVQLEDEFDTTGPRSATVKKLSKYCNRAELNGGGLFNNDANLTCYTISEQSASTSPLSTLLPSTRRVRVSTVFGSHEVSVSRKAQQICVPTHLLEIDGIATAHSAPTELDHFNCYSVRNGPSGPRSVTVEDEIRPDQTEMRAGRAQMFCKPVEKTHDAVVTPVGNGEAHLMCYSASNADIRRLLSGGSNNVRVDNQFYDGTPNPNDAALRLRQRNQICVPGRAVEVP